MKKILLVTFSDNADHQDTLFGIYEELICKLGSLSCSYTGTESPFAEVKTYLAGGLPKTTWDHKKDI